MKILAIDIGGTAIKYAVMTEEMKMLSKGKIPTPLEGRAELIDALARHCNFHAGHYRHEKRLLFYGRRSSLQ